MKFLAIDKVFPDFVNSNTFIPLKFSFVMDLSNRLQIAKKVAVEAGKAILEHYNAGSRECTEKQDGSPLTKADLEANNIILTELKAQFPDDGFLSEESEDDK